MARRGALPVHYESPCKCRCRVGLCAGCDTKIEREHQARFKEWSATIERRLDGLEKLPAAQTFNKVNGTNVEPELPSLRAELASLRMEISLLQTIATPKPSRYELHSADVDLLTKGGGMKPFKSMFLFDPTSGTTWHLVHRTNGLAWRELYYWTSGREFETNADGLEIVEPATAASTNPPVFRPNFLLKSDAAPTKEPARPR